jgi:hypothetical protein
MSLPPIQKMNGAFDAPPIPAHKFQGKSHTEDCAKCGAPWAAPQHRIA